MCAIQRDFNQQPQFNPQNPDQQRPQPRYRFRWPIYVGLPLLVLVFLWFTGGMEVVFSFVDIMCGLGVVFTDRYILLACLGIACITILLIIRVRRR